MENNIKQFGEDVLCGKLEYLIVDLPPANADEPFTLMQTLKKEPGKNLL